MYKVLNGQYIEMTSEEIAALEAERIAFESSREYKEMRISDLKAQLSATDYKALKFAEGVDYLGGIRTHQGRTADNP